MGKFNWGNFVVDSDLLVATKRCHTCYEDYPEREINSSGICEKCQRIENKLVEKLVGKIEDENKGMTLFESWSKWL